jgi:hypothetical protein
MVIFCRNINAFMVQTYITYHSFYPWRGSRDETPIFYLPVFYLNDLAMRNTADIPGGKPIAVKLQPISEVRAEGLTFSRLLRHLWKKRRGFYSVPDTRHEIYCHNQNIESWQPWIILINVVKIISISTCIWDRRK